MAERATEPTEQELADFRGLLRLRLDQVDGVEGIVQKTLEQRRAAKARSEASLASDLQELLLGRDGLAMKQGAGGPVVDTSQIRRNRAVRTRALARIDREFDQRLAPVLLPKSARAPARRTGAAA